MRKSNNTTVKYEMGLRSNGTISNYNVNRDDEKSSEGHYKREIVWRNVVLYSLLHVGALYGMYLLVFKATWLTMLFAWFLSVINGLGITAGAHRLWSHKAYKANLPLKIILVIFNCMAFQNDVFSWVRDHRVHHKYSETDADPHNAQRGFFFCHIGWLLVRKHPEVKIKGAKLDLSDLTCDPVLMFQKRYYNVLAIFACFVVPSVVPLLWGENLNIGFYVCGVFRYCYMLHVTWCINSVAHMWGFRPYDKRISPTQNIWATIITFGEGWHNYHHAFPFDYRASEFAYLLNPTTAFIDFFLWIGWATDAKIISQKIIAAKKLKYGE